MTGSEELNSGLAWSSSVPKSSKLAFFIFLAVKWFVVRKLPILPDDVTAGDRIASGVLW